MITEVLSIVALGTGLTGVVKDGQAISNNMKAKDMLSSAQAKYDCARDKFDRQRKATVGELNSLGEVMLNSWSRDIGEFLPLFNSFKKVQLEKDIAINTNLTERLNVPEMLGKMKVASMKAEEVLGVGAGSLGAGVLAGIASYGGAMMFASASTGTAIASLSGAAATKATLAWFGGGSLATGGLGIAGGTAVLGGIAVGPALAVSGFLFEAKSKEKLAEVEKTCAEARQATAKLETMTVALKKVEELARTDKSFVSDFSTEYQKVLAQLRIVRDSAYSRQENSFINRLRKFFRLPIKVDYRKLSKPEKRLFHFSWLMTQILYKTLTTPLLAENGDLRDDAQERIGALQAESGRLFEAK